MSGGKTKADRQFELLDERLIDIQGKLKNLRIASGQQYDGIIQMLGPIADLPNIKEELTIIHKLVQDLIIADPERLKELAEQLKSGRTGLADAIKQHEKETK